MRIRTLLAAAACMLTATGLSVAAAPAASAHDTIAEVFACGSGGAKRCGYGGVTNGHMRVYTCDTYGDGYGFRVYYTLASGAGGWIDDANGSDSGCSERTPGVIVEYEACAKNGVANNCSGSRRP